MTRSVPDKRYKSILYSGVAGVTGRVLSALVNLMTIPLILHYLGTEHYAVWVIVSSLVVWMQLADLGIGGGLNNALAEANGRNDSLTAATHLSTALIISTIVAIALTPILYFASEYFPWKPVFNLTTQEQEKEAAESLKIIGFAFLINLPLSLSARVFNAYQKGFIVSLAQIVASLATYAFVWFAVSLRCKMQVLIMGLSTTPILSNILLWMLIIATNSPLKIDRINYKRESVRRVGISSLPLFWLQLGALLVNELVIVMVAKLGSLEQVTQYNILQRIYLLGFAVAASMTNAFYPAIREAFEKKQRQWFEKAVSRSIRIRISAVFLYSLVMIVFGDKIINTWLGNDSIPGVGLEGWAFFAACMLASSLSSLLGETLSSLDVLWSQVPFVFLTAGVMVGLEVCLFPSLGVSSVFAAATVATIFPTLWYFQKLRSISWAQKK